MERSLRNQLHRRENSQPSVKSMKSYGSTHSTVIKNLNMPVKFNDVDWSHINETTTHERFPVKKKEFNVNKNKNIVYFSKRKRLEHGQIDEDMDGEQCSTYQYSEDLKLSKGNEKKLNLDTYKRTSSRSGSRTNTDHSPRFTQIKHSHNIRQNRSKKSSECIEEEWTFQKTNQEEDIKHVLKMKMSNNPYRIKINDIRNRKNSINVEARADNSHPKNNRSERSNGSPYNLKKFKTQDFDKALRNALEDRSKSKSEKSVDLRDDMISEKNDDQLSE